VARDEIAVARDVQLGLLPQHAPEVPGWQVWLYTRPANHVGGDVVDAFSLQDGRMALALGDVAGKGLGAALLASKLQATVRALAPACDGLDDLAGSVNEIMTRDSLPNRFSTMIYVEAMTNGGGQVDVVNAGHCPPRILRQEGPVERLSPGGLPLGVDESERYVDVPFALAPGDALVIYSDGLTEARRMAPDRMFGEGGLDELLPQLRGLEAEKIGRRLVQAVDGFMNGERIEDDLSLIVLRRDPVDASAQGNDIGASAAPPSGRATGPTVDDPHAARREHHAD
jgi:serine phosphatase RsbU (regulator of sigma subunit)